MTNYSTLKNEIFQNKLSQLSDKYSLFWAFSQEQLAEGLKKIGCEKSEVVTIGMGGILPKKNVDAYFKDFKALNKWLVKEVKKLSLNEVILYELNNHECYYTGDWLDAYDVVSEYGITKEQVYQVYRNKNYKFNK